MNTFLRSEEFDVWLAGLKDKIGRARIVQRIRSAEHGNFGDCEPVGEGVSEMRIKHRPRLPSLLHSSRGSGLSASFGRRQVVAETRHQARHSDGAGSGNGVSYDYLCTL